MDAEVRAKLPSDENEDDDLVLPPQDTPPSSSEIEQSVRKKALLHPGVDSVEGVTVHFRDTLRVSVDVDIRLEDSAAIQAG
jgi:hypothetical protein